MKKMQSGFTLIELVMVIVILGILAASALPKFVDLSGEAEQAAADGAAGALASAASINYAAGLVGNAGVIVMVDGDTCTDIAGDILEVDAADSWPAVDLITAAARDDVITCTATVGTATSDAAVVVWK